MAGDVEIREQVILLNELKTSKARAAVDLVSSTVLHDYGSVVVLTSPDDDSDARLAAALPGDLAPLSPDSVPKSAEKELDETARLGLAALRVRSSESYQSAKASRPLAGEQWDSQDASAPACNTAQQSRAGAEGIAGAIARPTSQRLSGSVAVGLIIVEGPTRALQFTNEERTTVVAETQNGLSWLGSRHPSRPITWRWDIDVVRLTVAANSSAADNESRFRDPALAALGYGPGLSGARAYAEALRTRLNTDWAYVAIFTKYPTDHFAYAYFGGPLIVMDYFNDGWGPSNIDRVFAHETGHIFNAPDEYASSGCNCGGEWGYYGKPNANCGSCAAGGGVECIMSANSWAMCTHTPWHLGFPMCPTSRVGVQFRGTVPAKSTRRWFTFSWPADCHIEWTVVPTTPAPGGPQISWDVWAERAAPGYITYWITINNLTDQAVGIEGRYAVLGST